jgi:DNA-binding NarL/FixJ family response regulator
MRNSLLFIPDTVSLSTFEEIGLDRGDDGKEMENMQSRIQRDFLMNILTARQRKVTLLLLYGYSRKDTAAELNVCLQAIHQIVLRIRKRLVFYAQLKRSHEESQL